MTLLLSLLGCDPFDHLPHQDSVDRGDLWDPNGVLPAADGLYVPLPLAGGVALVAEEGEPKRVDLGEGLLRGLSVAPGGVRAGAFFDRYRCPVDDKVARDLHTVDDCDSADLDVATSFVSIEQGEAVVDADLGGPFNRMSWSPDARFAIAWIDLSTIGRVTGVVNATAVDAVDTAAGTAAPVSVGFEPHEVLFTPDSTRAVVLSQSAVAVVDLATASRSVKFALTLDPDEVVEPVGVDLTPDGRYALISIQGRGDLYVLDLVDPSVNIVSLAAAPAAMRVDTQANRTVLVYGSKPVVEIVDHDVFDVDVVPLDEPATQIADAGAYDVLSRPGSRDVIALDPLTGDTVEFRLQQGLVSLAVSPGGEFAVAFTGDLGASPAMEILDLTSDGDSYPYLLEGAGLNADFVERDGGLFALILQTGVDYVYELDLRSGAAHEVALEAPPLGIGSLPDGTFYVTHRSRLGLVSFLDPVDDHVRTVAGFGSLGFADPIGFVEAP